jgi:hypothetical protein
MAGRGVFAEGRYSRRIKWERECSGEEKTMEVVKKVKQARALGVNRTIEGAAIDRRRRQLLFGFVAVEHN